LPGLVHRSEMSLVDHAGLTKLVVVLNIQTMHIICNRFPAREQILPDESGGCSAADEVAGEARPGHGESPQASAGKFSK
jgi:hypothetical protein